MNTIQNTVRSAIFALALLLHATSSFSWGTQGHQVIANLAAFQLTPQARAGVDRLLALEPGQTLESISTWADEHRDAATAAWHYVNFPKASCTYDPQRDCPDGNCVVGAIDRQMEILASTTPDDKRLLALKYVVHFVGDVHQPLHAGFGEDRGGNAYQLQAFGFGSNLHALWDTGLIDHSGLNTRAYAARLRALVPSVDAAVLTMSHAAEESCRIVGTPDFYPDRLVPQEYVDRFTPVLNQRLALAAARLAGLLNRALR